MVVVGHFSVMQEFSPSPRWAKLKTSYLVTLSKRVGRGLDQISNFKSGGKTFVHFFCDKPQFFEVWMLVTMMLNELKRLLLY